MPQKLTRTYIQIHLVAAAALALPIMRLQAQPTAPVDSPAGYEIACSMQAAAGSRPCDELPSASSCEGEADYASQPSHESTDIAFVNRSDKPVKVYWLNFQGQRVLYNSYLAPGGRHTQQTFIGHNWLVATLTEQCLGIFTTAAPSIGDGSVSTAPPALPEYEQPPPPQENLVWTPGYWAWSEDSSDYYWVPGTWVDAPIVGYLWTPGYWVARRGVFAWRAGYWGPHVGFYGGINYGYGYFGRGFVGGSWRDGRMMYNSAVTNVGNLQSTNVYEKPMADNASITRASYNGGGGGISAQPNAAERAAATEYHIPPTAAQLQQLHAAHNNPAMRAGTNSGHPSIGATSRPGEFMSASNPPAQHAGTLSIMHATSPPHPARAVSAAVPSAAARAASTSPAARAASTSPAARAASTSPAARAPSQPRTPQPPAHAARAEQQAAPQDSQQPRQNTPQTRPRTVPHAEAHPP